MTPEMARWLEIGLAAIGGIAFLASWILNYWLWHAMPTQPDVQAGFAIEMINHGRVIYLSPFYSLLHNGLFWGGLGLFACAVGVDFYLDPFGWRKHQ